MHIHPIVTLSLVALALALGACAQAAPERPRALSAEARLPGPAYDLIEVQVRDIPPGTLAERVTLLGPAGTQVSAAAVSQLTRETGPGLVSGPGIGVAVSGGSRSGIHPSVGVGWTFSEGGPSRQTREITFLIPLPPEIGYLESPETWRIEVRYLDVTGAARILTLSPPPPG